MATDKRDPIPPQGREVSRTKADCMECGRPIMVIEYERGVGGRYCEPCRQAITQEIYDECTLLYGGF